MTALAPQGAPLQLGGPLRAESLYLTRACDAQVLERLRAQRPCQVLGPAQSGRSSLRLRCERLLRAQDIACAGVDLRALSAAPEGLSVALLAELHRRLELPGAPGRHAPVLLQGGPAPPLGSELTRYCRDEILFRLRGPVVLLLDNGDTLPPGPRAELCQALRALFEDRAADPRLQRLTLCALGTEPLPLPGDTLLLGDLQRADLDPLLPLIPGDPAQGPTVLNEVFAWSGGHPRHTLALCQALRGEAPPAGVEALARRLFLSSGAAQDEGLAVIAAALRAHPEGPLLARGYEQLRDGAVALSLEEEPRRALWRVGLVTAPGTPLAVRSRIIAAAFDAAWARAESARLALLLPLRRWEEGQRDEALLLRGEELARARRFAAGRGDLTRAERDLLDASEAAAQRERQGAWALRAAAVLGPLLLLGALISLQAYWRGRRDQERLREVIAQYAAELQLADARAALKQVQVPGQEWRALQLALFAARPLRPRDVRVYRLPPPLPAPEEAEAAVREVLGRAPFTLEPAAWLQIGAARLVVVSHSADAALTATSDDAGQVHLWDTASGRRLRSLPAPGRTEGLALHGDGRLLRWSPTGAALYRAADGALLREFAAPMVLAALSPDGAQLASCDARGAVTVWDARGGAALFTLPGEEREPGVKDLRFSPDGGLLLVQNRSHYLRLWDLQRRAPLPWLAQTEPRAGLCAFSADGQRLLLAGRHRLSPPRVRGRDGALIHELSADGGAVSDVALSPDGGRALVSLGDNYVGPSLLFDGATPLRTLDGVGAARFSRDGRRLLGWGPRGSAILWETESGKELGALPRDQNRPAHTIQALHELAASAEGERLWLRPARGELAALRSGWPQPTALAYGPRGELMATGDADGQVRLWSAERRLLRACAPAWSAAVRALRFSADGQELLALSRGREVARWRVADGALLHQGEVEEALTEELGGATAIAPDLSRAARGGAEGAALWPLRGGGRRDLGAGVSALAFSADGRRLAVAGPRRLAIYDLQRPEADPVDHAALLPQGLPRALAFSPSGAELFVGAGGCGALIDLESGSATPRCRGGEQLLAATFYGAGARPALAILSGSPGQGLALWEGRSGQLRLLVPRGPDLLTTLSPAGDELAMRSIGSPPALYRPPLPGRTLGLSDGCRLVERLGPAFTRELPRGARNLQEAMGACRRP